MDASSHFVRENGYLLVRYHLNGGPLQRLIFQIIIPRTDNGERHLIEIIFFYKHTHPPCVSVKKGFFGVLSSRSNYNFRPAVAVGRKIPRSFRDTSRFQNRIKINFNYHQITCEVMLTFIIKNYIINLGEHIWLNMVKNIYSINSLKTILLNGKLKNNNQKRDSSTYTTSQFEIWISIWSMTSEVEPACGHIDETSSSIFLHRLFKSDVVGYAPHHSLLAVVRNSFQKHERSWWHVNPGISKTIPILFSQNSNHNQLKTQQTLILYWRLNSLSTTHIESIHNHH